MGTDEIDGAKAARLVAEGASVREIAEALGVAQATVRRWLTEHVRGPRPRGSASTLERVTATCPVHGETTFVRRSDTASLRCLQCRSAAVSERRRRVKATLVAEAGGACALCGYSRCVGALQFHHREPDGKRFTLSERGIARSLDRARAEAAKCVLLCANCHAEVEAGVTDLPRTPTAASRAAVDERLRGWDSNPQPLD